MRAVIAALGISLALLPRAAGAQMQEEILQVPTSPETRAAAEPGADAAEETAATGEDQLPWREVASPYDIERIEANPTAYAEALEIARRSGTDADRAELARILADLPQPIDPAALPGNWNCRTVRFIAEPADFRVYDWFPCRITELPEGLLLEKLGGSELTAGYLYPDGETRMIYLGHAHGPNEPPREYGGAAGPTGDDPANRDDPAILTQRGPDKLLLVKPYPVGAPDYDVLEFRRQ